MAKTNKDRVGETLSLLGEGLAPFVEREMKAEYGDAWQERASESFREGRRKLNLSDPNAVLGVMWSHWNNVFRKTLGPVERSYVSELREARNQWAHMERFSTDDAARVLDTSARLLTAVSAGQAQEVEKERLELQRIRFDEQRRHEDRKSATKPIEGQPTGNLRPWREIVTPHPDVASGKYQQAEFAADLWTVYLKEGSDEYKDPGEFFRRTFLTDGLKQLLTNAVRRLGGVGGDPVVELQTNFGGGKTHSMLALYHLMSGMASTELLGVDDILKEDGLTVPEGVNRAVVVGTKISPGQPHKKEDGTLIHTLWGEIAWQLGGADGYALIKEADVTATNPGDALRELFNTYSPCLILIDEWVAYARQLHEDSSLPAGIFDTQFTFAQTLTETVKAAENALLVVSVPASESPSPQEGHERISDIEVGGERGRAALARLKNAIGRVEASWRPASAEEGFEIVRRRLFQDITDSSLFVEQDRVIQAFSDMYRAEQGEFPSECREADYKRRLKAAYPIHPELFDRLYDDWSSLEKFQRTRGVLRLMAAVINRLWERQDNSLLIMPATVPIDDPRVADELTRYLEDQWRPVIEKDVDGPHSLPLEIDGENPSHLGRYSACRRVARTIYLGSAPTTRTANRGIDEGHVKLGCVQPGESVATFGDGLRRLTDRATHLYVDGRRYWYSTTPTVSRVADDRAGQLKQEDVHEEIVKRLGQQARSRGDFGRVHSCAPASDIPDEREARLVILGPTHTHASKQVDSDAYQEAAKILETRGTGPRTYKNMLVFLAPDANRLRDLEQASRQYLAWQSVVDDGIELNLDAFQSRQAETRLKRANETVDARIPETYQWLLTPGQNDLKEDVVWAETRLQGQDTLAARATKKMRNEESLMAQVGGVRLKLELDRIPLWRGNHVAVKQLAEDFATYLYLPRLKDETVVAAAVSEGVANFAWQQETFAYAEDWDEEDGRYRGLVAGRHVFVFADGPGLVVHPDAASEQLARDRAESGERGGEETGVAGGGETGGTPVPEGGDGGSDTPTTQQVLKRFHGSASLDPVRVGRDASQIADEVVTHLTGLVGANVEVTLEIRAEIPDGADENTVRVVTENCRTLRFTNYDFEEE